MTRNNGLDAGSSDVCHGSSVGGDQKLHDDPVGLLGRTVERIEYNTAEGVTQGCFPVPII